jgi:hypothetical protein
MTPKKLLLGCAALACLVGLAFMAKEAEGPGPQMVDAAAKLLGSLEGKQKEKASLEFDDPDRTGWYFTPQQKGGKPTRKGLPLEDMTADQKKLALELLRTGTSEEGYKKATGIMGLENILLALEKGKGPVRNPEWYFVTIFGKPTKTGKWGWRLEGHHLSLNYTLDAGAVVSATPCVFAANPAEVKSGKSKGLRVLPESMDDYAALRDSLDEGQKAVARQAKLHHEIKEAEPRPTVGAPKGLAGEKMTEKQQAALWKLVEGYASRLPADIARSELGRIKAAGAGKVHFAYAVDEKKPGKPHTYRVQGPTFVIEYINEQMDAAKNPANHIHSAWRNMAGDFGLAK